MLPIINLLAGIQRQGRQDITVTARKGGLMRSNIQSGGLAVHPGDVTAGAVERHLGPR